MIKYLKDRFKKRLFASLGVCFNPYGVPFILGKHLKNLSNINLIDVGAHQGSFTLGIDQLCTVQSGILIEPQPIHASRLREHFSPPRFQVVEAAISDRVEKIELEINSFDATTSILKTRRELPELSALDTQSIDKVSCQTLTLDLVFEQSGLPYIDLLKLDVQGAEHLVIRGGAKALAKTQKIWTEVSFKQLYEESCLYNEIFELLGQAGFSLFELDGGFRGPNGELIQADALFIRR